MPEPQQGPGAAVCALPLLETSVHSVPPGFPCWFPEKPGVEDGVTQPFVVEVIWMDRIFQLWASGSPSVGPPSGFPCSEPALLGQD